MIFYCTCKLCIEFQTSCVLNFKQNKSITNNTEAFTRGSKSDVIQTLFERLGIQDVKKMAFS